MNPKEAVNFLLTKVDIIIPHMSKCDIFFTVAVFSVIINMRVIHVCCCCFVNISFFFVKMAKCTLCIRKKRNSLILFFTFQPETILSHLTFLLHHLVALDEESLVHIARVLDPSRPSFRSLLTKLKTLPKSR
jgi:hypothetical protein